MNKIVVETHVVEICTFQRRVQTRSNKWNKREGQGLVRASEPREHGVVLALAVTHHLLIGEPDHLHIHDAKIPYVRV